MFRSSLFLCNPGDLWSYNAKKDVYVVSPDPDLHVYDLDILRDRCLILATDGAWNVISPDMAVESVYKAEKNNEKQMILSSDAAANGYTWINPSKSLVDYALDRWQLCRLRADNTSIVTVMLDPPGPPRAQVLRKLHSATLPPEIPVSSKSKKPPTLPPKPHKGIAIISRFPNSKRDEEKEGTNLVVNNSEDDNANSKVVEASPVRSSPTAATRIVHDSTKSAPQKLKVRSTSVPTVSSAKPILSDPLHPAPSTTSNDLAALERLCTNASNVQHTSKPPTAAASASSSSGRNNIKKQSDLIKDSNIVKNSISSRSSSNCENKSPSPPPLPERQSKRKTSHSSRQSAQQQQQLPPHQPVRPPKHKSSSSGEAPIIPVKQPRRSVCPDNNVDYNSDAENQERPRRSTRSSHSGGVTTGSVAVASAPSATRSQKAVVTNLKSLASTSGATNSSRRSMPLLKSSATSSSPSSSGQGDLASNKNSSSSNTNDNHGSNARVLRSRNTVAELDSAGEDVSGGVKRKRRTLEATSKKHSRSCSWNPASVATANSAKKARVLRNK